MENISSGSYQITFGEQGFSHLRQYIEDHAFSNILILTDSNTRKYCLPAFLNRYPEAMEWGCLNMAPGEKHKTIETCLKLWSGLSEMGADRKSLLINLGGGVVTDLGGFVASTYQRGISFINIPTTLLSMVDASVGGKTGVDLGALKNQIGIINNPQMVLVESAYLNTLDERQIRSGLAEMLKHGLILDRSYWNTLRSIINKDNLLKYISRSIELKNQVVTEDPLEGNLRKILNFGHTLGHAIESYYLDSPDRETLLHGEAIALGMILEAYLSVLVAGLPQAECDEIKEVMLTHFPRINFNTTDQNHIVDLLKYDKKNVHGKVLFSLLERIGKASTNYEITMDQLRFAFDYYKE